MTRTRTTVLSGTLFILAAAVALTLVFLTGRSSGGNDVLRLGAGSAGLLNKESTAGEGPASGYEAYRSASRTYPANTIAPQIVARAKSTFLRLAKRDARLRKSLRAHQGRGFQGDSSKWRFYGPRKYAVEPGVLAFSGATNVTASRTVALVADPDCSARKCRIWAGTSGGGVWRTDNVLAPDPVWKQVAPEELAQNSVGQLVLDPGDRKHDTLILGTGEGNRCSSGCEAGVGLYKSRDGGNHWTKLPGRCVSNATYTCVTPGKDAFLGRGINGIVIDPRDSRHMIVGSALAVRGLSHTIGNGGTTRLEPGANQPGLYESFNGGETFTEVWNGNIPNGFGVTDVGLDPRNPDVVYASAFDAGAWRRDAGAAPTAFQQVFAPQFNQGAGIDRTMFALTAKSDHTRIYLTDGTANGNGPSDPLASNFWRTDVGDQPAATLLASQGPGASEPNPANVFPATYTGWKLLTSKLTTSPFYATDDFCWAQCWYDEDVYSPAGLPDTVYVIGAFQYGELPCNTKGVGCGDGRSNGRAILYSHTAGDPDGTRADRRTFTDLTNDARDTPAPWCAFAPYFDNGCLRAPNGIHPDQHEIIVNPGNRTQVIESNDGGVIRTSGAFADISSQCDDPGRPDPATGEYATCKRLLSRVPTALDHIDNRLSSTLQFINVAINPMLSCEVMGGTQDNGTWSNNNGCSRDVFNQVIYGDGGNAVYDATEPTWRANEFTGGFGDSNFRNGDPERWVIATAPLVRSGEPFAFYWPQTGDPNPQPGTHPIYNGGAHVWRSWAFGAGTAGAVPQDTTPNIAFYEANCPEFVTPGNKLGCGDYQPLGAPGLDTAGDLTGAFYGADRTGGSMSFMARSGADHGTMWAATSAGRIFVSHNVNASDPATVTWHRIDNATSPTRFPSGIYVDPADAGHAWVTYSGYNAATPTTPGHVFEVSENGAAPGSGTFTNLNVESGTSAYPTPFDDGDLPVSDVVRDDATHTLYVATDFGVLRGSHDGHDGWHTTLGMPRYEVMHLEIQPSNRVPTCMGGGHCARVLYAATHSQGIWRMKLNGNGHH
ncbi:MAG: WD40/YVTN/BNR-like repeat-containing protein [Gaiellaceae bacterium]